jgi:hypothetical protein
VKTCRELDISAFHVGDYKRALLEYEAVSKKSKPPKEVNICLACTYFYLGMYQVWQYGLWSFQTGGTILERFLPKNQYAQRKFLNFENWIDGGLRSFRKPEF